jgi:predicted nuclease of predicted toxin-antitoxin system
MKILADENIEREIVDALRRAGHIISDIKETTPGIEDTDVLMIAADSNSILLTNDKDFGELIYRDRLASKGVILLRFGKLEIAERIELLLGVLGERESELQGAFTVITSTGVRIRK